MTQEISKEHEVIIDPDLECSVCNDILFRPVSLNCGHTYCKECLVNILRTKPQCPLCRTPCFLQESNLKENVTIKTIVDNKYPAHVNRRLKLTQTQKPEETKNENDSINTEPQRPPFNPLAIFPLVFSEKVLFPGTEETITIRINYNPMIVQNVCNDKRFLAIPDDIVQDKKHYVTCILEFIDLTKVPNTLDQYKAKVKTCERVAVNHYSQMELDKQVLEGWGIQESDRIIVFNVGNGYILKDHNIATPQQIETQVVEIEEFFNEKLNYWMTTSPNSAQFVITQMNMLMQRGEERTMNYFIDFSFTVARILRASKEDKKRLFETTNTLERLLVLKQIIDGFSHTSEFGMIIDHDIPGHTIFNSLKSAILVLIGVIIALYFFNKVKYH